MRKNDYNYHNADNGFIKILKEMNKKLKKPYEFIIDGELIDSDEIQKEVKEIKAQHKAGTLKAYKDMKEYRKEMNF
jgi:GMP synthase PP-ATPase subunit